MPFRDYISTRTLIPQRYIHYSPKPTKHMNYEMTNEAAGYASDISKAAQNCYEANLKTDEMMSTMQVTKETVTYQLVRIFSEDNLPQVVSEVVIEKAEGIDDAPPVSEVVTNADGTKYIAHDLDYRGLEPNKYTYRFDDEVYKTKTVESTLEEALDLYVDSDDDDYKHLDYMTGLAVKLMLNDGVIPNSLSDATTTIKYNKQFVKNVKDIAAKHTQIKSH